MFRAASRADALAASPGGWVREAGSNPVRMRISAGKKANRCPGVLGAYLGYALLLFAALGIVNLGTFAQSVRANDPPRVAQAQRFLAQRGWPGKALTNKATHRVGGLFAPQISASSVASTAVWQPLGPAAILSPNFGLVSGRVSSIAIDPADATGNHVLVGTTGGGVWVSQNAGAAGAVVFSPLTDTPAAFDAVRYASISIGAVSVQPGATGVILAGTGDPNDALDSYYGAGVLRSADGGNTWTVMSHTADAMLSFQGEGFAGFAWSTVTPQLVVAAVSQAYEGTLVNAQLPGVSYAGLYYSTDAGASWSLATISDSPGQDVQGPLDQFAAPNGNSATAVVWNPVRQLFFAAVRFHGYYQSPDGILWTRIPVQPGTGLTTQMCPSNLGTIGSIACPVFRGALAVNPVTGDTFAWTVDLNNQDQGLWQDQCAISNGACANPMVAFARQWSTAALQTNSLEGPITIANGDYNLVLGAVPSGQDTLLFAGVNDLWKCSLAMGCIWRNTTNAATCMSAQVAPYQHALAWNPANPQQVFIGNDSGLWRSNDAIAESGSVCSSSDASHFQNLNAGLGSLGEVESMSQVGSSPYNLLAGFGVNGASGVKSTSGPTLDWPQILGGEGGPVAADAANPSNWFVNNGAGISIYRCAGSNLCSPTTFGSAPVVGDADVGGDAYTMTSPAPFIVDPLDSTQLLVGTCRLWRGPADGSAWSAANALSPILDGVGGLPYCSGDGLIRTIAALPLATGGEVIYVGMYGAFDGGATVAGHVFKATFSPTGSAMPLWQDLTLNPVVNDQAQFNFMGLDISSIFLDGHDATGNTVYVAVEGAEDSLDEIRTIYRSTDGAVHWHEITSNLPHSPANSVVIDPQDANTAYIATDEGVYSTRQVANCAIGSSNCWSVFGAGLPYAPVVQLSAAPAATSPNVLVAGTYGRGIWQIPLWTSGTQLTSASAQPASLAFSSQAIGTTSSAQTIQLSNTGGIALVMVGAVATDSFSESDNCVGIAINSGASCAIQVTFTPVQAGVIAGQLTISLNVAGGQITIPLAGTGTPAGLVTASPANLSFGQVAVGTTSSALPVTVQNAGSVAIAISGLTVTPPFALAANACGVSLAANSDCALSLTFDPTQTGAASGTLTLTDAAGTQTVALSGTGAAAAADALSPTTIGFPSTVEGQLSSPQIVTLSNNGDLTLTSIAVTTTAGFIASSTCGTSLGPHASCAISVVFAPPTVGTVTGSLQVVDAIQTQTVALAGTGLLPPAIAVAPAQLVFATTLTGQASAPLALRVTNSGGAPMSNVGFQISGAAATSFSWSGSTCAATLASGSSCTVQVGFTPAAAGPLSAMLVVSSSTAGVTPVQVPLSGIGQVVSGISITPAQMTFTQPTVGQASAAQTATITNTSAVAAIGLALSASTSFSVVQSTCTSTLASGASCSAGVVFTPAGNETVTGALSVTSTSFLNAATAVLTGIGGAAGSIQLQPAALSFPVTGVGNTSATQAVTLSNNGSMALVALALTTSPGFQLASTTCGSSLAINASCTAHLSFAPSSAGQQTGNLTVASSALAASAQVPLSAMGFDFSVTAQGQSSQTVASGQTASYGLALAPLSGSSGTFTFTCSSLPSHTSCAFNPASEAVAANTSGTVTVNIATGVSSSSAQNTLPDGVLIARPVLLVACGLLALPFAMRRRRHSAFLLLLLLLCLGGLTSCGGSGGGGTPPPPPNNQTPAGTYSVAVTATSCGVSHKVTLTLTVD